MSHISEISQLLHVIFNENNRSHYDFRIAIQSNSDRILNMVYNVHSRKAKLTNEEIEIFLKYCHHVINDAKMYNQTKHYRLLKSIDDQVIVILDYYYPKNEDVELIIESRLTNSIYKLIHTDYSFNHENFKSFCKYFINDVSSIKRIYKMVPKNEQLLESMTSINLFYYDDFIKMFNELIYNKIIPSDKSVENCFQNDLDQIINIIIHAGGKITMGCFYIACEKMKLDLIKKCLYSKLHFDNRCFNTVVRNNRYRSEIKNILDLMIKDNYSFTKQNIKLLIEHKINYDYNHFKVEFDDDIMLHCSLNSFYPEILKNKKLPYECLLNECNKRDNLSNIKMLIESYNLKPNQECLYNACTVPDNSNTIEFLMDYNLKLDWVCIENLQMNYDRNISNKIRPLINMLIKSNLIPSNHNEIEDIEDEKYSETNSLENRSKESHEEEKLEINQVDHNEKKPKSIRHIEIQHTIDFDFQKEYQLKTNFKKQFKVKESKISFIKLRQLLIQYIVINKLFSSDNQKLIRIDSTLSRCFNLEEDQYLHLFDFDYTILNRFICY